MSYNKLPLLLPGVIPNQCGFATFETSEDFFNIRPCEDNIRGAILLLVVLIDFFGLFRYTQDGFYQWSHRLAWPRTPRFQCGNMGSNPIGTEKIWKTLMPTSLQY